jgi:hypothetical protein
MAGVGLRRRRRLDAGEGARCRTGEAAGGESARPNAHAASTFDPTNVEVFQAVFGMILMMTIALEFKRSLLVVAERSHSVVQVRLDVGRAAAILALGAVYWLVRDQDRQEAFDRLPRSDARPVRARPPHQRSGTKR